MIVPPPSDTNDAKERTQEIPGAPREDSSNQSEFSTSVAFDLSVVRRYIDWGLKLVSLLVVPLFVWIWQHDRSDVTTVQTLETVERDMQEFKADLENLEASVTACHDRQAGILVLEAELTHLQEGIRDIKVQLTRLHRDYSP